MRHTFQVPMVTRRQTLRLAGAAAAGGFVGVEAGAQGRAVINLQVRWLLAGNQLGEAFPKQPGYSDDEGIHPRVPPGGPRIVGVNVPAAGRDAVGRVGSSQSLVLDAA